MLAPPWLLALALVVGLLVLIPARRLQLSGFAARTIGMYALGLWLLAMAFAIRPAGGRILVPFLLVVYLAPFVAGPDQVRRIFRRRPPGTPPIDRPPMKDVTPPDAGSGS
ncbi:MAG: hypothetical protein ACSLFN_04895 [Candidatus Limnocylindrales bacterium]